MTSLYIRLVELLDEEGYLDPKRATDVVANWLRDKANLKTPSEANLLRMLAEEIE